MDTSVAGDEERRRQRGYTVRPGRRAALVDEHRISDAEPGDERFDLRTLLSRIHGDDDQIVPFADSAALSSKIVKNAKLVVYNGAPHGMCTTLKDRVNEELLGFIKA